MSYSADIFTNHLARTSPAPLQLPIARAEGSFLYAPDGKRYIDMIAGIGVSNVGHRHPHVVSAIQKQLDKHLHVMAYGEYIQSAPNLLAQKLAAVLPDRLNCTYLVNSGTEANEGALKLAKKFTGRSGLVACQASYHGSTMGSLSVSGNESKKKAFHAVVPDVHMIPFNEPEALSAITEATAGVIVETVQGDAGVRIPDKAYMLALRQRCDETGALLILDEIQCGLGRTGTLFAFEQFGMVPDILTLAKALGGGLPIGAFISDKKIMDALSDNPPLGHITTFGGNPVCCAAALATLEVLDDDMLLSAVETKGRLMESLIQHPQIVDFRRIGLLCAIDFNTAEKVNHIIKTCIDRGVITYWFLSNPHSMRLAPPLTIDEETLREACATIVDAIDQA